jgi:translation initiation factor IF-3
VEELGFVESSPKQDGRNMVMVLGPVRRKADVMAQARADRESRKSAAAGDATAATTETTDAAQTEEQ